jgi:outer membrane scaffolding protein for murein synthesis (MipA/OmpV family)
MKRTDRMRVLLKCLCVVLLGISTAQAQEEPLWEIGFGAGLMSLPDYRGSDEGKTYALPIPYFAYNGDRFRIDRRGVRGDLVQANNVWLDVSMNLGPPAESDQNQARAGMPDLDPTIEVGPSLRWRWWESQNTNHVLTLYLPARAVIASDFSRAQSIGWVFAPHFTYDYLNFGWGGNWNFSASFGPLYATEKFHDYYYQVSPEYATPTRPAYDADAGYSGLRTTLTLSRRFADYWVGGFVRHDALSGATFEDSPLMRKNESLMVGFGVTWIFARSKEKVPAEHVSQR